MFPQQLGLMAQACDPGTWGTEAGELWRVTHKRLFQKEGGKRGRKKKKEGAEEEVKEGQRGEGEEVKEGEREEERKEGGVEIREGKERKW